MLMKIKQASQSRQASLVASFAAFLAGAGNVSKNIFAHEHMFQNSEQKIETEGRPPWRDPSRNSVNFRAKNAKNGCMATHFFPLRRW